MEIWRYCYVCGSKKPAKGMRRIPVNGHSRNVCKNCFEDYQERTQYHHHEKEEKVVIERDESGFVRYIPEV